MTTENITLSPRAKTWLLIATIIAVLGMAVSLYSTNHHLNVKAIGSTDAICNINKVFSCDDVAKSEYSEFFGIPLGVWGLGYFFALFVLSLVGLYNKKNRAQHMQALGVLHGVGGLISLSLFAISLVSLGVLCPTCIVIYILCLAQVVALFLYKKEIPSGFNFKKLSDGLTTAGISLAIIIIGFNLLAPSPSNTPEPTTEITTVNDNSAAIIPKVYNIPLSKSAYSGLGEDFRKGGDEAKVIIQEFADFQCPHCRDMGGTLKKIHNEYKNRVLIVFRNYPLDGTCNSDVNRKGKSCAIAAMARCAGQYGKFWLYHDLAYSQMRSASDTTIVQWAKDVGLTQDQIDTCLADKTIMNKVKDDAKLGNKLNIRGTPTVYINGQVLNGHSYPQIKSTIEKLLQQ